MNLSSMSRYSVQLFDELMMILVQPLINLLECPSEVIIVLETWILTFKTKFLLTTWKKQHLEETCAIYLLPKQDGLKDWFSLWCTRFKYQWHFCHPLFYSQKDRVSKKYYVKNVWQIFESTTVKKTMRITKLKMWQLRNWKQVIMEHMYTQGS